MPPLASSTGLTITNPLVLYRALLATKQIDPDPAQHRLAIHLQKVYHRLLDYEPEVEYSHRIKKLSRAVGPSALVPPTKEDANPHKDGARKGILATLRAQKEAAEAMALTRKLTDHEAAISLKSPQGLLLYGEVGTGKSMLVDLLADCLPKKKKRRWHFNTFMLETFARLEQLRRSRLATVSAYDNNSPEHSLLWLARDMISTSPILFLDEFQLPDRASSKILSTLFTSFFQLGGVLIATTNRMPEELANASGVEFAAPPPSQLGLLGNTWGIFGTKSSDRIDRMLGTKGDFAAFLDVLQSRCEVFHMEGSKDWRRIDQEDFDDTPEKETGFQGLEPLAAGNVGLNFEQSLHIGIEHDESAETPSAAPKHYVISSASASPEETEQSDRAWTLAVLDSFPGQRFDHTALLHNAQIPISYIPWESTSLRVYGRKLFVPRHLCGVSKWTFSDLCCTNLGPADYISLASNFHTFILEDVPILSLLHKNEARRLITLLDALYEAHCRLLIRAAAGPDGLFFPETQKPVSSNHDTDSPSGSSDGVYPETFSEIYQDSTSPFRPNISSYTSSASPPSYTSSTLPSSSYSPSPSNRSILADEDSDFGPTYGAGRSAHGPSDGAPGAGNEIGRQAGLDFTSTSLYTGEDERFAYKRARSRLWEICGARWWSKEDWWRPLSREMRQWEGSENSEVVNAVMGVGDEDLAEDQSRDEKLFRHGASPFRTAVDPPPKIPWTHAWGMMTWGKKAGAWGKGPEGLKDRSKDKRKSDEHDS